jgi:hypothetical protein
VVRTLNCDKDPAMAFFQTCSKVFKEDIMVILKEFHSREKFEKSINATFISLIPKKVDAVDIEDFYPSSLVGRVYKSISKVLSNKLKKVLKKIILSSQNAFIKESHIQDQL